MSDYPINDDDWMLEHVGYTAKELRVLLLNGEDITDVYDGDPIELL
jgi:hypothetical protein